MKTYHVTAAHEKTVVFRGKRTDVKRFIKNNKKTFGTDPLEWDVLIDGNQYTREWGEDFLKPGFKFN